LEVANEWSCAVNSNYQLDRMRNCFTAACLLIKAARHNHYRQIT